jgi:hypothetical protein
MARAQRAIAMIAPVANGRGKGTFKILSDLDAYKTALDRKKGKEWLRGFAPAAWQVIFCRRALAPGVDISSVNPERTRCRVVAGESSPALPPAFHNDASGCRWRLPSHLLMLSQKGWFLRRSEPKAPRHAHRLHPPNLVLAHRNFRGIVRLWT